MNNKFLSFLAIISILFAVFMAWQKFTKYQNDIMPTQSNPTETNQPIYKADATIVGFGKDSIILDINGQRRTARFSDSMQIYLYKPKSDEVLATELKKAVEQGLNPPESGEYIAKTKNDLMPNAKVSIESQNDISKPGDIILFKIILK